MDIYPVREMDKKSCQIRSICELCKLSTHFTNWALTRLACNIYIYIYKMHTTNCTYKLGPLSDENSQ